jgi:NADPH:quinone reductase-like Zn-dependent oxidoreductase
MKAVQFSEYGGPEVFQVVEADEPHAGSGQLRIAVRAVGVNPVDWKVRAGMLSAFIPVEFPSIPGQDAAGVVDEVGAGVTGFAVGDEVFGTTVGGAAAQYAVLVQFAGKPAEMTFIEAAALPTAVETGARALDELGVKAGQTLLINGVAGGVGLATAQLAQQRGITVLGTASAENNEFLSGLGVTTTTYGPGLAERVAALGVGTVDFALDTAGKGGLPELIKATGSAATVLTIADAAAGELGVRVSSGTEDRAFYALAEAAKLFTEGKFSLPVAQTFPLSKVGEAQALSQAGHVRGKLVIVVD